MNVRSRLLATATLALAFTATSAFAETLSGTVSDSMCSKKHVAASASDQACIKKCMEMGDKPVLVVGDKVYQIDNADAVKDHLGHKVTVTGKVTGDSIHIDTVKM